MNPHAAKVFRDRYKGEPNPLTPELVRYSMKRNKYAIELSRSDDCELWGVTVLLRDGSSTNLSKCLGSQAEADAYIRSLT